MPSYRKEKHGLWTRQRAKSGPADTYTTSDGRRYEIHHARLVRHWYVDMLTARGSRRLVANALKTQREARQWIIENVIERNEK